MDETLYPHEVICEYIKQNVFRLDAAILFVWAGCNLIPEQHNLINFGIFFILGLLFQGIDYKYRGLN